jgi:hypothetical protein
MLNDAGNGLCLLCSMKDRPIERDPFLPEAKPSNLRELKAPETDVKETLEKALAQAEGFEGVVVIALTKDGKQWLRGSSMTAMQKAFLLQFHQAVMTKWFALEDDV